MTDTDETVATPPDLSTKPKDIVGYCFGFSCPYHHIGNIFESITVDRYGEQMVCQTCGEISTPAIVKRTAEAQWIIENSRDEMDCLRYKMKYMPRYGWHQTYYMSNDKIWTKHEIVRFLNDEISVSA
jgi:hypothetical protein